MASAVGADDIDSAAVQSEIEVLKQRLAKLESKLAKMPEAGISSIGEKPGRPTLELPSGLQGLQMSGYADVSYQYSFNEPNTATTTTGRAFDTEAHGFTPHAFELVLEKPITDEMPFGFRSDLFFGDDAAVFKSTGLGLGGEDFDLQQAYITARAPIGDGLDFKIGKFVTLLGAEVIESPANWNFSRSFGFFYSIPFTHTGVLASYPLLGEWGSTTLGVVNGWDIVDDNNKAKSLIGNITLTPPGLETVTLSINGIHGAERATNNTNKRTVISNVLSWTPIEQLALMADYDYGHESNLTQGTSATGFEAANWQGLALYAKYDFTPIWSLAGRWEWFDDKDNTRTVLTGPGGGTITDIDFYGYTLTSQWKLYEHVLARLEYRHDKADDKVFVRDEGLSSYQDTVAAEMIYHF
ncbi:MAG: porin [Candidatus Omnitrophica bacterium]|nr:porin [Candidatus Omnitrophota bacterium]